MRVIRKTVTFYFLAREGKTFANEITKGSFLAHQHANNIFCKNVPYRRFLGELTKSKEVEERPELEIMATTPHSGNKNLFSPSCIDDQTLYIRVFSGIQWSSDVICC